MGQYLPSCLGLLFVIIVIGLIRLNGVRMSREEKESLKDIEKDLQR